MSLKPSQVTGVPKETMRVARAAFPKGNLYLSLRDKLGSIFHDDNLLLIKYVIDSRPRRFPPLLSPPTHLLWSRRRVMTDDQECPAGKPQPLSNRAHYSHIVSPIITPLE
jgi:hypothetical protein